MRLIKFRGWIIPLDGKPYMAEDLFIDPQAYLDCDCDYFREIIDDERCSPMQFTGLTDKNGKEIYEGDILNAIASDRHKEETRVADVIFADDLQYEIRCEKGVNFGLPLSWGGWDSLEVIGNILENPELLTK